GRARKFPRLPPCGGAAPPRRTARARDPHGLPRRPAADRLRPAPGRRRCGRVLLEDATIAQLIVKLALGSPRNTPDETNRRPGLRPLRLRALSLRPFRAAGGIPLVGAALPQGPLPVRRRAVGQRQRAELEIPHGHAGGPAERIP